MYLAKFAANSPVTKTLSESTSQLVLHDTGLEISSLLRTISLHDATAAQHSSRARLPWIKLACSHSLPALLSDGAMTPPPGRLSS
eukprot:CAMPEP_0185829458 /NCGR_PEP_ID=MMETSP1353-20130828/264_1 /TAXON_ID=1077150 /ORGANISM="Erythrolobus australicus, Strain CCMP3124" /LENGTH=84 /DNA_ID=CAMNT_0028527257 /DNA_START=383 /DNA_END=634 /DNA_ORIENTATION=-